MIVVGQAEVLDHAGDRVARVAAGQVGRRVPDLQALLGGALVGVDVCTSCGVAGCTGSADSATDGRNA